MLRASRGHLLSVSVRDVEQYTGAGPAGVAARGLVGRVTDVVASALQLDHVSLLQLGHVVVAQHQEFFLGVPVHLKASWVVHYNIIKI